MPSLLKGLRSFVLLAPIALLSAEDIYKAVSVDGSGQLHITLDNGRQLRPAKVHDQVSFDSPALSADHKMVGWLVDYPDPFLSNGDPLAGALVLYSNGHALHTCHTDQMFWDWGFKEGGKQVAYSTGPTHGGAAECVLVNAVSGKVISRWLVVPEGKPPAWATALMHVR